MFLYGKNSVKERLLKYPKTIKTILLQSEFKDKSILFLIKQNKIPIKYRTEKELLRMKKADRIQGIIAEIEKFQYKDINMFFKKKSIEKPLILFLDKLNDPHNLGSVIRICACFGNIVICIPKHKACPVNETVLHVASGGENYVNICAVANLSNTLVAAKKHGYWIAGADVAAGQSLAKETLPAPLGLILGSEWDGISTGLKKYIDVSVTIPMKGAELSLNVAMACAIFCYEISKK
jgi:23S rRNA (guanosine2251-2'-O)-methyltransferase